VTTKVLVPNLIWTGLGMAALGFSDRINTPRPLPVRSLCECVVRLFISETPNQDFKID
jgi:hypothetical protein